MTQATEIAAGQVITLASGEYSDYRVILVARVLKPINAALWEQMRLACFAPPSYDPEDDPCFQVDMCAPWLLNNDIIEEIEYTELHLGDYGELPKWENA